MENGGVIINSTRLLVPFAGAIPQHIVASFHARARKHQSVGARFPEFAETHPRNHPDHMRGRRPSGHPARLSASAAAAAVVTQKSKGALASGEPPIE